MVELDGDSIDPVHHHAHLVLRERSNYFLTAREGLFRRRSGQNWRSIEHSGAFMLTNCHDCHLQCRVPIRHDWETNYTFLLVLLRLLLRSLHTIYGAECLPQPAHCPSDDHPLLDCSRV